MWLHVRHERRPWGVHDSYGMALSCIWAVWVSWEKCGYIGELCGLCRWAMRDLELHMGCGVGYGCMGELCGLCKWVMRNLELHMGCRVGCSCMVEVWEGCGCMWGVRDDIEGCMGAMGREENITEIGRYIVEISMYQRMATRYIAWIYWWSTRSKLKIELFFVAIKGIRTPNKRFNMHPQLY